MKTALLIAMLFLSSSAIAVPIIENCPSAIERNIVIAKLTAVKKICSTVKNSEFEKYFRRSMRVEQTLYEFADSDSHINNDLVAYQLKEFHNLALKQRMLKTDFNALLCHSFQQSLINQTNKML